MSAEEDICARCRRGPDPDLRTLWMRCMYDMAEMNVPFVARSHNGELVPEGTPSLRENYHTLRVCKSCRSSWLSAVREWWHEGTPAEPELPTGGSGIFVRELGAIREVSEEEWARTRPGREPVRFKP